MFSIFLIRRNTRVLQQKVDDAYTKMRILCNSTIHQDQDAKRSHYSKLIVPDSNGLIEGLQTLLNHSSSSEKIRLLTIAPVSLGRSAVVNFLTVPIIKHEQQLNCDLRMVYLLFLHLYEEIRQQILMLLNTLSIFIVMTVSVVLHPIEKMSFR